MHPKGSSSKIYIHPEGLKFAAIFFVVSFLLSYIWMPISYLGYFFTFFTLCFFRNPKRNTVISDDKILSPVDGKVVIIKKVFEKEYFKDERLQISVFMSPINVHVTRYPSSGEIVFSNYHPGDYLVAWHPKSSEKNERTTIVLKTKYFGEILYRQIAGALARRIVNYAKVGEKAIQGEDAGFIKFGSRVDLFLPLDSKIKVKLNQKVIGGETVISN